MRDAAGGERLQCRDQKWQVAERAERKLERILELGALDRDVAMEARNGRSGAMMSRRW